MKTKNTSYIKKVMRSKTHTCNSWGERGSSERVGLNEGGAVKGGVNEGGAVKGRRLR